MKIKSANRPNQRQSWALTLLCLLWLVPACANTALELSIIPLKHRLAGSLTPSLAPLIKPPHTLTAAGNQLLLRADKATSAQLRLLIDELDQPLRQYLIELRQGTKAGTQSQQAQATIREGAIRLGGAENQTKNTITVRRTSGSKGGTSLQSISALEGYPTYIETGKEIPMWSLNEQGVAGKTYKAIGTGFYATLLSSDDKRFVMQLSTKKQEAINNSNLLTSTHTQSTLSGRLGEWTAIGGSQISQGRKTHNLKTKSSASNRQQQTLYLRVTERY